MGRREQREHIFKLLFMAQFNPQEEMPQQISLYFDSLEDLKEEEQAYMEEKYQHVLEHLQEIDRILNEYQAYEPRGSYCAASGCLRAEI